eukprot:TRINITY_DN7161_c0_g1_i1.p1 TRINITY_DN7161_c0_g1~~TRINITY_DN7161_c0_g1_i1.p1  ORF type:complete len:196 (+),score=38.32 TRINITY_DN7161_c0_g1_i1:53-640(+)
MQATTTVPLIDLALFLYGSEENKKKVAKEVFDACTDIGFFIVRNYESILPREKIDRMFKDLKDFFELPLSVKSAYKGSHNRGYFTIGEENLTTVYTELNSVLVNKELGDYKEGIDLGREIDSKDPEYGLPFRSNNKWPTEQLGQLWKDNAIDYHECAAKLSRTIMRIFAIGLKLEENWFEDKMNKPMIVTLSTCP